MVENVYEGLNARKCVSILKCSKTCMKAEMLVLSVFIQSVFLQNVPDLCLKALLAGGDNWAKMVEI